VRIADLEKPITKRDLYKLALAMWALKIISACLRGSEAVYNKLPKSMRDFLDKAQWQELWNELLLPVCLFLILLVALWIANGMSFQLPHYQ